MHRLGSAALAAALTLAGAATAVTAPAAAATTRTYAVTTTADRPATPAAIAACARRGGRCTLRAALGAAAADASTADLVVVRVPAGRYDLRAGALDVRAPRAGVRVLVTGAGAARTIVDGGATAAVPPGPLDRVVVVHDGEVELRGLTIQHGSAPPDGDGGGGVLVRSASETTLRGVILRDNIAEFGGGIVQMAGALRLDRTTVSGNRSPQGTGPATATGPLVVERSTISGNDSLGAAPGGVSSGVSVTLRASTITGNRGDSMVAAPAATIVGSTVAANVTAIGVITSSGATIDQSILSATTACAGAPALARDSVIDGPGCGLDRTSVQAPPALGPLGDHGGPTETMVPATGSAALDRLASCPLAPVDQRGAARPAGGSCDAGAVEAGAHVDLRAAVTLPPRARVGRPLILRARIRNLGADRAEAALILALGTRLVARSALPAGCRRIVVMAPGTTIACTATLRPGAGRALLVRLRARSRGTAVVRATAEFEGTDLHPQDDAARARVRVGR